MRANALQALPDTGVSGTAARCLERRGAGAAAEGQGGDDLHLLKGVRVGARHGERPCAALRRLPQKMSERVRERERERERVCVCV